MGADRAACVAGMLGYIASKEYEKKILATDSLEKEKYEEINFLYDISGKIASCLGVKEVTKLVLDEAIKPIEATSASVMLLNEEIETVEIIAAWGKEYRQKILMRSGEWIAGHVLLEGKAEIVNDVLSDSRYIQQGENLIHSLICAPLTTQSGTIGVINISSTNPVDYTAQDLKLLTALASQAAEAIENALLHENKLREERIKSNLERYLSPQVVQAAISEKGAISLNPTKRNIVVLFSDIRNFTSKCEELAPEEIVMYLNEYFTQMVSAIFSHQGTVNKFVGDMIVAMFGAPYPLVDQEKRAIAAAIDMQRRITTIAVPWIRDNFATGIGISAGEVVVGNIGSPQHLDYTAIGDEVNIASRLQSMAKGGQILCSQSVYHVTKDIFEFKKLGTVTVKGRKKSVETYEVLYHNC
ncbi:MAG: GAF domain-containing protein [Hormoscilla sp. GM7CHS1pb]|nr:GAF domain-containing protein [Hormoscilla sp. GM7CHS1pb]